MTQNMNGDAGKTHDPVSGMTRDLNAARFKGDAENFNGKSYRFCPDQCQSKFHHGPARHTHKKTENSAIPGIRVEARR
jgi:YHS domain-containing protein